MLKETILTKLILLNTRLVIGTYTAISLPVYTLLQKPWRVVKASKQQWSKVEKAPDGSYYYWKRIGPPVTLPHDYHLCNSFLDIYNKMKQFEDLDRPKLAYRKVLSTQIKYDSKGQPIKQDGRYIKEIKLAEEFTWLKTREVFEKIDNISRGLASFNLGPKDKVVMFADTRIEWFLSTLSLMKIKVPVVTLFSNLGQKGFIYGVNQQKSKFIITSFDLLDRIQNMIDQIPSVEKIIYMQYEFQKSQPIPKFPDHIRLIPFDDVETIGQRSPNELSMAPRSGDEIALIIYTSGTTGIPKAVVFNEKQIRAAILCLSSNVFDIADESPKHIYASFLPLAHSLGFTFEMFLFSGGVRIGYSSPYTLTDSSPGNPPGQLGDLKLLKPTTIVSVPLILDRIVKEIYLKLSARSPILPPLFTYLMEYKTRWTRRGYSTPILDKIVCKRVQEQFGGNLQYIISGGAALNPKTEDIIRAALNVKLLIGYGLTETTGGVTGKTRDDLSSGNVGIPLEGVYLRLVDWEEGGYTINDKPNPRGEVLIGGDSVAQGYYGLEEETKTVFTVDSQGIRWVHSGDIGEILPNGSLRIIDRKKDLTKLPNGEYISLGKIETTIKSSPTVENCCVCSHDAINDIVALVTPSIKQLKILAEKLNKSNLTHEQLCADAEIRQEILNEIQNVCRSSQFHAKEIPVHIHICDQDWTPDNDLLTSAFKLKRNNIMNYYKKEIEDLFKQITG